MLDFSRFEILTFDCYGTLINWEDGILGCLRRILATHGQQIDDATILRLYGDFEAKAEQGEYRSYREVLNSVVRRFGKQFGFAPCEEQVRSLAESLKEWKPWPDTVEALRLLESRFRLAIISNVDDDLFAATRPQLAVEFSQIVTAQQARAYKPSLKIFELALSRIGVPAHRILHVGQSLYHDVIPAQSLGMATVWVNRPSARKGVGAVKAAEAQPELQVISVAELATACAQSRS
ncbi:MAG TPA: haloacid dehalogenase type II [Candidatus Deferrimicrobiaceae bacterium]|jgi:2-haloacid dehalogenase|nr:haloacid dehalogenase type II [Candidatus Deferrimicrobiaceae bacterium]